MAAHSEVDPRDLTAFGIAEVFFKGFRAEHPELDLTFADVGANLGLWTKPFRHKGWRVYAFEAFSQNFANLQDQFSDDDRVTLFHNAVWNSSGESVDFFYNEQRLGIGSIRNNSEHLSETIKETVSTITVSEALGKELPTLNLIKTDVEGAELQTLQGAQLETAKPEMVIAEVSGRSRAFDYHANDLVEYLDAAGFDPFLVMAKATTDPDRGRKLDCLHFWPASDMRKIPAIGANMDLVAVRRDTTGEFQSTFSPFMKQLEGLS